MKKKYYLLIIIKCNYIYLKIKLIINDYSFKIQKESLFFETTLFGSLYAKKNINEKLIKNIKKITAIYFPIIKHLGIIY